MEKVYVFDTTLRDGEQSPGCSMHLQDKLEMAHRLQRLKVDVIEAGFAASSPGDFQAVQAISAMVKDCSVASLSRALTEDIDAYFAREVLPYAPDAWIDTKKTKVGYEIPMTRYFYEYQAPEKVEDIMARLSGIEAEIQQSLAALFGGECHE